ncbi:MAG TPA: amidohydrolase family protein [Povalibacter sp.]|nr:amidohydrolase family protein [Povalibacter sp.]
MKKSAVALLALASLTLASIPLQIDAAATSVTVKTQEVTAPSIALSPDGQTLVIGMLGHLFEVPAGGGHTTQLTFGPSYDSDPAISPDGRRIAFTSNRDGSGSNIFVLDRTSKHISQITHDIESSRAAWSPDGQTLAYTRHVPRDQHPLELIPGFGDTGLRELRTVSLADGSSVAVGGPQAIETVFYLADGRLAWTVRELGSGGMMGPRVQRTRIEARQADGSIVVLAATEGDIGRVAPAPKGDGVYYSASGAIQRLAFDKDSMPVAGSHVQENGGRVTVSADGQTLFFGDAGQLWRASAPAGEPERIAFTADISLQVQPKVKSVARFPAASTKTVAMHPALAPTLAPDGKHLVVMAGGFLWEQSLSGGPATRLLQGNAFVRNPAYSPDGSKLAYVASENGKRRLDVYDFASKQTKTLFSVGGAEWPLFPSWSPDGRRIVFQHSRGLGWPASIIVIDVNDGTQTEVAKTAGSWQGRPHFSSDARSIYFTNRPSKIAALYRVALSPQANPEAVTDFSRHVHEGLVSPDGKWFAQRRNSEIWVAPMQAMLKDAQLHRFSAAGGRAFSFTPDSSAIVYSAGDRVYRQPLSGGRSSTIPVRIDVQPAHPAPVLVDNVRVLDLTAGRFTEPQSMLIEDGRIRWIGDAAGRRLPSNLVRLEGHGRFAIPGLFDVHVHSAWFDQQTNEDAFIAFGVTSIRDTGSALELMTALDDRSNLTAAPAPRYFYSGEIMEGTMPLWGDAFYTIGNEQEARAEVRSLKARGADFVKIYPSLPWHLQGIVADEAHRVGLPVVGHGLSLEEIVRRVDWGSTSIEHSQGVTRTYEDVLNMLVATHTPADLTLSVGGGDLMAASDPGWQTHWRVLTYVPEESRRSRASAASQSRAELLEKHKDRLERIAKAHAHGVTMPAGTDSLMGGVYFGLALHWEIAQFTDAGIPAIDVLRAATQGGADLVGASRDLGSLTPGKLGDVVLLDSDPLQDIRNTQTIWRVIKGGEVYDPATLRPGIRTTQQAQ